MIFLLMGELAALQALPIYQLALSFSLEAWRQFEYRHKRKKKQETPSRVANGIDAGQGPRRLFTGAFGRAQPQRNMCWLHRLLNHRHQLCA